MSKHIKLNSTLGIDRDKLLQSRMVILANSGGGKSYAVRKFAEESVKDTQTIIIDPEGEFASLREKFDFILAGKNADVPAEVRSAELLAIRLLELNKSAVIDLYELHPQERQRFVKLFLDAMINAPKELYHPVFLILDEAHEYAPEGKPSEATYAVEAMASRGRKRGFCLIPASQRISKLSKNVSAECNNKLIGRASQDIDMKRAGDELGFNKESMVQLRRLQPGEFFAFGPAISDDVIKLAIGEVKTTHAKVTYRGKVNIPPPSSVIKKILAEIKDLPKEAEKEAKTAQELKLALMQASQRIVRLEKETKTVIDQGAIQQALQGQKKQYEAYNAHFLAEYKKVITLFGRIKEMIPDDFPFPEMPGSKIIPIVQPALSITAKPMINIDAESGLKKGERLILISAGRHSNGITRGHLSAEVGYKQSARDTYISRLSQKGMIESNNGRIFITQNGIDELGSEYSPIPLSGDDLRHEVMNRLSGGESIIMQALLQNRDGLSRDVISELTGYKQSARDTYISRLRTREIVKVEGGIIKPIDEFYL